LNRNKFFSVVTFSLLFIAAIFMSVQTLTAKALVPSIVSVTSRDVGSTTWVDVVVFHQSPPTIGPSHYVSNIELEINGTVQDLAQSPQTTETFTVQVSLGPKTNTYLVRARAFCIVHGYSAWSSVISVPEFSLPAFILLMVLGTGLTYAGKKTLTGKHAPIKQQI
jgi:hypothetical protein